MWKYIRQYLHFAVIAAVFMIGEVLMDLIQPSIMSRIVDEGVLGLDNGGIGNLHLIWTLGAQMIGLVLIGGLCGSLNSLDGNTRQQGETVDFTGQSAAERSHCFTGYGFIRRQRAGQFKIRQ